MRVKDLTGKKRAYSILTKREILKFLDDGEWRRNKDILAKIKGSSATIQKHLNELAKGIVEKKRDLESKEYPHPVYYRLKPQYVKNSWKLRLRQLEKDWQDAVLNEPLDRTDLNISVGISRYVEFLNVQIGHQLLGQIRYFLDTKNEIAFSQAIDLWVLAAYRENAFKLKEKLEKLTDQGVNVQTLIWEADQKMSKHYDRSLREK
jgi:DNA-binding transcriptional ArsR family regulator